MVDYRRCAGEKGEMVVSVVWEGEHIQISKIPPKREMPKSLIVVFISPHQHYQYIPALVFVKLFLIAPAGIEPADFH
jgi:hypothetical protein